MKYFKPLVIIGLVLFLSQGSWAQQCSGEFAFKASTSESNIATGKIVVTIKNATPDNYIFKVFKVSGEIELVKTIRKSSPESISIDGLEPANYFIKIEWGSCHKTIGGIEGITVSKKAEEK